MFMRIRFILILALGVYLCASCQQISTPPTVMPQLNPEIEEYAVYNALLESKFASTDISQILFIDQTDTVSKGLIEQDLTAFQKSTPLEGELINSFMERNQKSYPLKPDLDFGLEYQLLTQEEVDELRSQDKASGWTLLYDKYPNAYGFVHLSPVGFNADFSQALVFMGTYHYDRLLEGGYYLMIRQNGSWIIEAEYGFQS